MWKYPYPHRWQGNKRKNYTIRLIGRGAGLLIFLIIAVSGFSFWADATHPQPTPLVHWDEIPLAARPASRRTLPDLPYTIHSDPPWLKPETKQPLEPLVVPAVPEPRSSLPVVVPSSPVSSGRAAPAISAVPSTPKPNPGAAVDQWVESLLPGVLEATVPVFTHALLERLDRYMQAANHQQLAKRFSEQEIKNLVVQYVQPKSQGQLSDMAIRIQADGLHLSGTVNAGEFKLVLDGRFGFRVVRERTHVVIREVRVGSLEVSEPMLRVLEKQMNQMIDEQTSPVAVKEFRLSDDSLFLSVERV